jgi:hypothetical protein
MLFHFFRILSLILIFYSLSAKKTIKQFSFLEMKEKSWQYLTKFGYERGTGSFSIRAKLTEPIKNSLYPYENLRFQLSVFLDVEFPKTFEKNSCGEKNGLSRFIIYHFSEFFFRFNFVHMNNFNFLLIKKH